MKTQIFNTSQIKQAATLLENGEVVAFPTETVYGLGANALDKSASSKIFQAKGRPSDNPLIVHICSLEQLEKIALIPKEKKKTLDLLIEKFWPGPLTIILPKRDIIPLEVSGGLETVAIRMPNNKIALDLIQQSNLPLAAPSANISGLPSGTQFEHVLEDFDGKISGIIQSEPAEIGLESTVLDLSVDIPTVLRPGGLSVEKIQEIVPETIIGYEDHSGAVKSPGMKYKHYSPLAQVILFECDDIEVINNYKTKKENNGKKILIIFPKETENFGKNLFSILRDADKQNYDFILIKSIDEKGPGRAIMNRLKKAATEIIS